MASMILFLIKSTKDFSKKILIGFFLSGFFFFLYYYAFNHNAKILGSVAFLFGNGVGFYLGPFTYFYLRSLYEPKNEIVSKLMVALIPFFLHWILVNVPVALSIATELFRTYGKGYAVVADYINLGENLFFLSFLYFSFRVMRVMKQKRHQFFSETKRGNLIWYRILLIGLIVIIFLDSLFSVYELIYPPLSWNIGTIIAFLFVILYSLFGYRGIFQSHLKLDFAEINPREKNIHNNHPKKGEVLHPGGSNAMTSSEVLKYTQDLSVLMEKNKIFKNESLRLNDLADQLGISTKKLSELLNHHMNTSFYNLVNDYRVAEVKTKLQSKENSRYTLVGLAFDSGFQSKASFNRVFKEKTGMSPGMYRKKFLST